MTGPCWNFQMSLYQHITLQTFPLTVCHVPVETQIHCSNLEIVFWFFRQPKETGYRSFSWRITLLCWLLELCALLWFALVAKSPLVLCTAGFVSKIRTATSFLCASELKGWQHVQTFENFNTRPMRLRVSHLMQRSCSLSEFTSHKAVSITGEPWLQEEASRWFVSCILPCSISSLLQLVPKLMEHLTYSDVAVVAANLLPADVQVSKATKLFWRVFGLWGQALQSSTRVWVCTYVLPARRSGLNG